MSEKTLQLACIGECMIELQETGPGQTKQTFGGDTLNTAIYSARLADTLPLKVDYVTAVGTDTFSARMIDFWELEGVGSDLVLRQEGELPGLYYIELDDKGERIFHYWRSVAAAKKCFEYQGSPTILKQLGDYDGIYLSGISLAIFTETSRAALICRLQELANSGIPIYFDCNYRPHLWPNRQKIKDVYSEIYPLCETVFLTTEEAEDLFGTQDIDAVHKELKKRGVKESVIKNGDKPCSIHRGDETLTVPAQNGVQIVDTTAAGDSFSAVYLVSRCFGCPPEQAAKMAHKAAAYVVQHKGAIAPKNLMPISGKDIADCSK
ncbi:sugar kinase [Desulforhopalus sp. 52FAK]